MSSMTDTHTMRLAALDIDVPAAPFTLGISRTWRGRDGQGYEVKVMQGRTLLGTLGCEGSGDGVYFRALSPGAHAIFDAYVRQFDGQAHLTDIYDPLPGMEDISILNPDGPADHEGVATMLAENALLAKTLKSSSRRSVNFILGDAKPTSAQRINGGPDSPEARAWLRTQFPGQTIKVWVESTQTWDTI